MTATSHSLVEDLSQPQNLPESSGAVEVVTTHGSHVFLTGNSVYKVKRAKDYGFLDYTDAEARRHFCHEEVRLNRRAAPSVYLGVLPVYRNRNGYSMTREGDVADWAVHMRRLPDDRSALALAQAGALDETELEAIARAAARFYRDAEHHPPDAGDLRTSIEENFTLLDQLANQLRDPSPIARLRALQDAWLEEHASELEQRARRDGHGDLRLEHVYLMPDGVQLIDCIEFLARFRIADPALDAAFLAMDLHRVLGAGPAESFLGHFVFETDDFDAYPLADGYMSYRATVRGKVACIVAADPTTPADVAERKRQEAQTYLRLACDVLTQERPRPHVIAVGGMIGSGKTTLARAIAAGLHVPVVSADATRKNLGGIGHEERGGAEIYTDEFNARVMDELLRRSDAVLRSGRSVLVDTTFAKRSMRTRVHDLAADLGARFTLVECAVPEQVTRQRLRTRAQGLSDAGESLLDSFLRGWEPIDELPREQHVRLDTTLAWDEQRAALAGAGIRWGDNPQSK